MTDNILIQQNCDGTSEPLGVVDPDEVREVLVMTVARLAPDTDACPDRFEYYTRGDYGRYVLKMIYDVDGNACPDWVSVHATTT